VVGSTAYLRGERIGSPHSYVLEKKVIECAYSIRLHATGPGNRSDILSRLNGSQPPHKASNQST
jgi:hypothetical protein